MYFQNWALFLSLYKRRTIGNRMFKCTFELTFHRFLRFAATMSTGALAVVLANTPNQFTGLQTIGKIFFTVDLVLFALFNILISTRFILVPQKLPASIHHPVEGLFYGAYWVSVSLILNCAQAYGVPSSGPWLVKALEICFWIYCGVVFVVGVAQYYVFFQTERLNVADAVPAWIFPIYPLLVVGTMAGTMIPSQPPERGWYMCKCWPNHILDLFFVQDAPYEFRARR